MYKRKTKLSPIHISLIALAILVVIAVIVTFAVKKDEPKEPTTQSGIVYDDSAVEGGWETLSQEEIEQRLNDKVQAGMINISCNTAPYFKDGKLPITAWRREREQLEQEYRDIQTELSPLHADAKKLWAIHYNIYEVQHEQERQNAELRQKKQEMER